MLLSVSMPATAHLALGSTKWRFSFLSWSRWHDFRVFGGPMIRWRTPLRASASAIWDTISLRCAMAHEAPGSRRITSENVTVLPVPVGLTASTTPAPAAHAAWISASSFA
jgi:hypothetical protein